MGELGITHVAVAPPEVLNTELISSVASVINKDIYNTRLLLTGKMPKLIAHYQSFTEAGDVAQRLKALGLIAVVCEDAFLRQSPFIFKVRKLEIKGNWVTFQNESNESKTLKPEQIFLLLKGSNNSYTEEKTTLTQMKFNLGKTLIMGGIPVFSKKKEEIVSRSESSQLFLRIYDSSSADNLIELTQLGLDYSFLGEKRNYSSAANINSAIGEIRILFPNAIFDDRLSRIQGTETSSVTTGGNMEVNCKLLFVYYSHLNK